MKPHDIVIIPYEPQSERSFRALFETLPAEGVQPSLFTFTHGAENASETNAPVLAVIMEVTAEATTFELEDKLGRARRLWNDAPLIAYYPYENEVSRKTLQETEAALHNAALRNLGFHHVVGEGAQLIRLLRNFAEHPAVGKTDSSAETKPETIGTLHGMLLPRSLDADTLRAAFEFVASLHFAPDQGTAAAAALAGLAPLVEAKRWTLYLTAIDAEAGEEPMLQLAAMRGLTSSEHNEAQDSWRRALLGDAHALSPSEQRAARQAVVSGSTTLQRDEHTRVLAIPLVSGERCVGVLEAARDVDANFTISETTLLEALAVPLAAALANTVRIAEAERLSQTDDLTKLHNGRFLRQFLTNELKRARRYGGTVSALFLDIDNFKGVNDTHGHLVGSHVLVKMAGIILESVRDTDVVARYGGDEFIVILPETPALQALRVADRVREGLARYVFTGGRRLQLRLTASFGVASFPEHAASPQQLISRADAAMYEAKAAGKNCVYLALGASSETKNEKIIS